jgi:Flp pilus assembly protein TadD
VTSAPGGEGAPRDRGLRALRDGDLATAAACIKQALALAPQSPESNDAWRDLLTLAQAWPGLALWSSRRCAIDGHLASRFHQAIGHLRSGDHQRALAMLRGLASLFPAEPPPWILLGETGERRGRADEALRHYERALALAPGDGDLARAVIILLGQTGASASALARFAHLLSAPDAPIEILAALVGVLQSSGRAAEAMATLNGIARRSPAHPSAPDWLMRAAGIARSLGEIAACAAALRGVSALAPDHGATCSNLSDLLRPIDASAAVAWARRSLALEPLSAPALGNLALACQMLMEFGPVESLLRRAVAADPGHHSTHVNLSHLVLLDGRAEEAERWVRRAMAIDPSHPHLAVNLSNALLAQGNVEAGFPLAENRLLEVGPPPRWAFRIVRPRWEGEPLEGRSLFVWAEQGIGDHFYFARYLPMIPVTDGTVIVEVDRRVSSLYHRSFPGFTIVDALPTVEETLGGRAVDLQLAISSLTIPFTSHTRQAIEAARRGAPWPLVRYFRAEPTKVASWEQALAARPGKLRVAISWRGGTLRPDKIPHYMTASHFVECLRDLPVTVINVQYGSTEDEIEQLQRGLADFLHPTIDLKNDLEDVAAILSCCDLLITAHTAVLYLAAGLGVPVWSFIAGRSWATHGLAQKMPLFPNILHFPRRLNEDRAVIAARLRKTLIEALSWNEASPRPDYIPETRGRRS